VIAGPDGYDVAIAPVPLGDPRSVDLKKLRVAFHTDNGIISPTPETVTAVKTSAKVLSDAGAAVEENRPTEIEQGYEIWIGLLGADSGAGLQMLLQMIGTTELSPFMQQSLRLARLQALSTTDFMGLLYRCDVWRAAMLSFLDKYDVILCPVNAYPALLHGGTQSLGRLTSFSYTNVYNLTGWPGVVVRGGTSPGGLPIGIQVVARPWREDVALAAALYIEAASKGWQRPPL
ncbi:MAG TPA: amidase family protein, partial [Candidatus Binatia bacterium]|nr:amidase family protein [Candidatus Binatia bacterium]